MAFFQMMLFTNNTVMIFSNAHFKHVDISEVNIKSIFLDTAEVSTRECFNLLQLDNFGIKDRVTFLLVLSALNFCFWNNDGEDWFIQHNDLTLKGSKAMLALLKGLKKENEDFAKTIFSLSRDGFYSLIQNRHLLQFLPERFVCIKEIGKVLKNSFKSNPLNLLKTCNYSSLKLVTFLCDNISPFSDKVSYKGHQVMLCKKAQFFVAALHYSKSDIDESKFNDIDQLTVFPDYRLPQVLRHFEILNYSPELAGLVDNKRNIKFGSEYEAEIRIATVIASEKMLQYLQKKGIKINAVQLDQYLWKKAKEFEPVMKPHHRTLTTYY